MQRPHIELPERFDHETGLHVRVSDVNYGGHLGNDAVLALLQQARIEWLGAMGLSEFDTGRETADPHGALPPGEGQGLPLPGPGLIMTDATVIYRSQAFLGDRLRIRTALADPGRSGFRLVQEVANERTGREVARASSGFAFFDYAAGRVARMPALFRARCGVQGGGNSL